MNKRNYWSVAAVLLTAIVIICNLRYAHGGCIHPESSAFLRIYNDAERSLAQIVFDPWRNDWGLYQARELSYFFDWLDAKFIYFCWHNGCFHCFSLISILALLLCVICQQYFIQRNHPQVHPLTAVLCSVVFAVAPCCGNFSFFRSAKPLVTLALTVLFFYLEELYLRRNENKKMVIVPLSVICHFAVLTDRIGLFFVSTLAGSGALLLILFSFEKIKNYFKIDPSTVRLLKQTTCCCGGAVVFSTIYNLYLAPALIFSLNGYRPSFAYQHIGFQGVFNLAGGFVFIADNIGYLLLHINTGWSLFFGGNLLFFWFYFWFKKSKKNGYKLLWMLNFAIFAAMLLCASLMTFRHLQILRDEVIHTAYFMPMLAIFLFETVCFLSRPEENIYLSLLLGVSLLTGIVMPQRFSAPKTDHLAFFKNSTPVLKQAILDPQFNIRRSLVPYGYIKLVEHFRKIESQRNI